MGRLLYDLGRVDEKTRIANERGSSKAGKSSFSWAWELDGTIEERERFASMLLQVYIPTDQQRHHDGHCFTISDDPSPTSHHS